MLQWFRARARSVGATALLSLVTLTVGSALPHPDDCHDAMCAVVVPHDPSAHSIGRTDTSHDNRPLHCVLCHWTRIVRPTASPVGKNTLAASFPMTATGAATSRSCAEKIRPSSTEYPLIAR